MRLAGVASVLPARVGRADLDRVLAAVELGELVGARAHALHATVSTPSLVTLSRRHSKVEPASLEAETIVGRAVGRLARPRPGASVIVVSGASASTVNARSAGVAST